MKTLLVFGSDRSPRRGDLVRASVRYFPQIMSSSSILKSPGGFYVTVELKRELTERAQREKSQREHTERAQREHLREHIGE